MITAPSTRTLLPDIMVQIEMMHLNTCTSKEREIERGPYE
jgi:hypothetical protein